MDVGKAIAITFESVYRQILSLGFPLGESSPNLLGAFLTLLLH